MSAHYAMIGCEQLHWLTAQTPATVQLWSACWQADAWGDAWRPLPPGIMPPSTFKRARRVLEQSGFFVFRAIKSSQDTRCNTAWEVRNLHGAAQRKIAGRRGYVSGSIKARSEAAIIEIEGCHSSAISNEKLAPSRSQGALRSNQIISEVPDRPTTLAAPCPVDLRSWYAGMKDHPMIDYIPYEHLPTSNGERHVRWRGGSLPVGLAHDLLPISRAWQLIQEWEPTHARI